METLAISDVAGGRRASAPSCPEAKNQACHVGQAAAPCATCIVGGGGGGGRVWSGGGGGGRHRRRGGVDHRHARAYLQRRRANVPADGQALSTAPRKRHHRPSAPGAKVPWRAPRRGGAHVHVLS